MIMTKISKVENSSNETINVVGSSLPKVCVGCGNLSTKIIDKKYHACCPDNKYIELEEYCKNSIYKPELFT